MAKTWYMYGGVQKGKMIIYVARDKKDVSAVDIADAYHYKLFGKKRNLPIICEK